MFGNDDVKNAARKRRELTEAERRRVAEYEQRRARLQAAYNEVAAPVLALREAERRMAELAAELDGTDDVHHREVAAFRAALREAGDPRLVKALADAKRVLRDTQRFAAPDDIFAHRRAAELLELIRDINGALDDPSVSERAIEGLIRQASTMTGEPAHV